VVELADGSGRIDYWVKARLDRSGAQRVHARRIYAGRLPTRFSQRCRQAWMSPRGFRAVLVARKGDATRPREDRRPDQSAGVGFGLPPGAARPRLDLGLVAGIVGRFAFRRHRSTATAIRKSFQAKYFFRSANSGASCARSSYEAARASGFSPLVALAELERGGRGNADPKRQVRSSAGRSRSSLG